MAAIREGSSLLRLLYPLRLFSLRPLTPVRRFAGEAVIGKGEVGIVSGVPSQHLNRKVYIYSPARTASQQGGGKTHNWKIRFDSVQKWENPLMGWTSTGDPLAHVGDSALVFNSKEAATDFASRHGWEFTVLEPKEMIKKPKAYADNFKWKGPAPTTEE